MEKSLSFVYDTSNHGHSNAMQFGYSAAAIRWSKTYDVLTRRFYVKKVVWQKGLLQQASNQIPKPEADQSTNDMPEAKKLSPSRYIQISASKILNEKTISKTCVCTRRVLQGSTTANLGLD